MPRMSKKISSYLQALLEAIQMCLKGGENAKEGFDACMYIEEPNQVIQNGKISFPHEQGHCVRYRLSSLRSEKLNNSLI
jgi:hypothetical protein